MTVRPINYPNWVQVTPANFPDFTTHKNYVECLEVLSPSITVIYTNTVTGVFPSGDIAKVKKKIKLAKLTKQSLDYEMGIISVTPDFAQVCSSWISVKSYYLLFNLFCVFRYLVCGQIKSLNSSHTNTLSYITGLIKSGKIVFSENNFNDIRNGKNVKNWHASAGANVRHLSVNQRERISQILKKLVEYSLEEFKRQNNIDNIRKKKNKLLVDQYLSSLDIGLISFFYWYRIKANYRDLEFIDKPLNSSEFKDYYVNYYNLTINFYNAFSTLINNISQTRFGTNLI